MKRLFASVSLALAGAMSAVELPAGAVGHEVKFISLSWNTPRADEYARRLPELEKTCPADGLAIEIHGRPRKVDGVEFVAGTRTPMGKIAWRYEDFTDVIAMLKEAKSAKFTHNLFYTIPCPGNIEWTSDSDWEAIINNYALAARVARETGMKGILLDIEQYGEKFWIPNFSQLEQDYEDICRIARRRGRDWGNAVFGQYPDILVFALTMFSSHGGNRMVTPFFNGVLDVMPPTAIFTDGHETEGYKAHDIVDYDRMLRDKYRHFPKLVAPENRTKYFSQVRLAPAFYLDAIFLGRPKSWSQTLELQPEDDRLAFLQRNLFAAMRAGEDFVWLYGERACWSTPRVKGFFTPLETVAPGIYQMVESLRRPANIDVAKLKNLLGAADFPQGLAPWTFWQIEDDARTWNQVRRGEQSSQTQESAPVKQTDALGKAEVKDGVLRIQGTTYSLTYLTVQASPGAICLFRVQVRHDPGSRGMCWMGMGYRDKLGKGMTKTDKSDNWWLDKSTEGEWVEMNRLVMIPPDATHVSVHLGTAGMRGGDAISFRNAFFGVLPPH